MARFFCALAMTAFSCAAAAADEPSLAQIFPPTRVVERRTFVLTGSGVHGGNGKRDYALGLYVEEQEARRAFPALVMRAGGRTRARLIAADHAQTFLLWGRFTKLAVFHFLRDFEKDELKKAWQSALEDELGEHASAELRKAAEGLLELLDGPIPAGRELTLRSDGEGHIELELPKGKKSAPQNPKLARILWSIWLGAKAEDDELRRALVQRIDELGR